MVRALDGLPFDVVQNDLKSAKAGIEIVSEALLVGQIQASFDPVVEKTGGLSSDLAHALPGIRVLLVERLPLKDTLTAIANLMTYVEAASRAPTSTTSRYDHRAVQMVYAL